MRFIHRGGLFEMETMTVKIDREKARELYRDYLTHQNYEKPIDEEIRRTYRLIAAGRLVIQALESVRLAGQDEPGFPKLAIARADQKVQHAYVRADGSARMAPNMWNTRRQAAARMTGFDWPPGAFPRPTLRGFHGEALVPLVPLPLRPKRGLENYHILWEADWRRAVPHDPLLLRRLGQGDLWLVLAQWDLTEVERAALATRVNAA
jgi:hypothetical protein